MADKTAPSAFDAAVPAKAPAVKQVKALTTATIKKGVKVSTVNPVESKVGRHILDAEAQASIDEVKSTSFGGYIGIKLKAPLKVATDVEVKAGDVLYVQAASNPDGVILK